MTRMRLLACVCAWWLSVAHAATAETITVYGATPVHVPQTVDQVDALRIGRIAVSVEQATMLRGIGHLARAPWHVRWRQNAQGVPVDHLGQPTTDSTHYVQDGWSVSQAIMDAREGPSIILDFSQHQSVQQSTEAIGHLYWYTDAHLHVVSLVDGLRFRSQADAAAFRHVWLDGMFELTAAGQHVPRLRLTPLPDRWELRPGCALPATTMASTTVPLALVGGAYLIVPIVGTTTYRYFRERDLRYLDPDHRDPYLRDGRVILAAPSLDPGPGHPFAVRYRRHHDDSTDVLGHVDLTHAITVHDLPEPYRSQHLVPPEDLSPLETVREHQRGDLDGQDMVALHAAVATAHQDQTGTEALQHAFQEQGYADVLAGPLTPRAAPGADPLLDVLRAHFDPDQIQNQLQAARRNLVQVAPSVLAREEEGAPDAWMEAIDTVNTAMRPHMEGNEGQDDYVPVPRSADMHPAGLRLPQAPGALSPDQLGAPIADGDNPSPARPLGISPQGAPFYDFNGNGHLDRWYTTDPFWGAYRQLVIRWDFRNDYRAGSKQPYDHMWAAYVLDTEGERHLLLAAQDAVRNRIDKRRVGTKLGVTFWGPALVSFLEPIVGRPDDEWRFALRYVGSVAQTPDAPWPPPPVVQTAHQTIERAINGVVLPWKTVTETVYLYPDIAEPEELAGAVWSDPTFTAIQLTDAPTMPAMVVITEAVIVLDPNDPQPVGSTSSTVFFPHDFHPDDLEPEPITTPTVSPQVWMWDYAGWDPHRPPSTTNAPWNYQRGSQFGRQSTFGFQINPPSTLQRLGNNEPPLLTIDGVRAHSDQPRISFAVRALSHRDPPADMTEAEWRVQRAMHHERTTGWDERTDMRSRRRHPHPTGERVFDLLEGLGWYIFRGTRRDYQTDAQHRALIKEMWEWYFRTPETVLQVQRINPADPHSPLLQTARPQMVGDPGVDRLVSDADAALVRAGATGMDSMQAAVERRERLINEQVYLFSAARGREWEVAYARQMPASVRLICVEYDCLRTVQRLFSTSQHRLEFIHDRHAEHRVLGDLLTHWMGQTPARAVRERTAAGYDLIALQDHNQQGSGTMDPLLDGFYDQVGQDRAVMGRYHFGADHTLYGLPAMGLRQVAVLDDGQYGSPRPAQWRARWTTEFRHPMLMYYDDRWSAIVITYGHNTAPYTVFGAWQDHGPVQEEEGGSDADRHRERFEAWTMAKTARLPRIYDALHPAAHAATQAGLAEIPAAPPAPGPEPQAPVAPELTAVQPQAPAPVPAPGPAPIYSGPAAPVAPWALAAYAAADDARQQWLADTRRVDASRPGHTYVLHGDGAFEIVRPHDAPAQFADHYWSGPWYYTTTVWGHTVHRGVTQYRGWSVLPHASRSVGGGSHHPHQQRNSHVNVVCAMIHNAGPERQVTLSFHNDDGGALYWNRQGVHTQYQRRQTQSAGSATVTLRTGWNEAIGTHCEDDGGSHYHFRMGGSDWVAFAAADATVDIYPHYPAGAPGHDGTQGALGRYSAALAIHTQATRQHQVAVDQWQDAVEAHQIYQDRQALYEEQVVAYQHAVEQFQLEQAAYHAARDRYPVVRQSWQDRAGPYDFWLTVRDEILAARALVQTYLAARDAWVLLAQTEIAAPGVDWSGPGTPVFAAYDWWSAHTPEGRQYP